MHDVLGSIVNSNLGTGTGCREHNTAMFTRSEASEAVGTCDGPLVANTVSNNRRACKINFENTYSVCAQAIVVTANAN